MSEVIFVGVDGGGTKSKLVMRDNQGELLGTGRSGAANIRLSVDKSISSIMEAFNQACVQASHKKDLSHCQFHIGLGLAGTEVPRHCTEFLAKLPHFDRVVLRSDAYAACIGAHGGRDGAILIIGTGVVGYRISKGEHKQVSGWGFPHDDKGGGAWIGQEVVRRTLEFADGRGPETPLLAAVYAHFSYELTTLVTWANAASATEFATLAPLFTEYLVQGDQAAVAIAEEAGCALMRVIDALMEGAEQSKLCLFGGLSSFLEPFLSEKVRKNIEPRIQDATEGALLMVKSVSKEALSCF